MKKIFLMLLFSISVIAYAAPPPDPVPVIFADNVQLVVQAEVQNFQPAVQEVAFNYLGNFELMTCYVEFGLKQVNDVFVPEATVTDVSYQKLCELNKPPADYIS